MASEIVAELQAIPDFIIGNYSDGNLVASLLAYKMGVTQVGVLCFRTNEYVILFTWKEPLHTFHHSLCAVHHRPCIGENKISKFRSLLEEV